MKLNISLQTIIDMYHTKNTSLAETLKDPNLTTTQRDRLLVKQSEVLGGIIALSKVSEVQHYEDCRHFLSEQEKRKIYNKVTKIN